MTTKLFLENAYQTSFEATVTAGRVAIAKIENKGKKNRRIFVVFEK